MSRSAPELNRRFEIAQRHSRRWTATLASVLAAVCLASSAVADVPDAQKPEVDHLLEYIRTSPCQFMRNGRQYPGERAYKHVLRKYNYFRDRIATTEEFIELSASVSTMSGEPYWFICEGEPREPSKDKLLGELERYRENGR